MGAHGRDLAPPPTVPSTNDKSNRIRTVACQSRQIVSIDIRRQRAHLVDVARTEQRSGGPVPLDEVDRQLVVTLSRNGRRSAAALAKDLGLSRQAVTERMRSLEERGVIRGYRADVDPLALGLPIRAQLRLALDGTAPAQKEKEVVRLLTSHPMVREVSRVSGEDCFVAEVICRRMEDVNALLAEIKQTRAILSSRTAFVLEQILDRKGLGALEPSLIAGAVAAE